MSNQILTPEVERVILKYLGRLSPRVTAANIAGIDEQVFSAWINKGRRGIEPYASFKTSVEQAEAEAEQRLTDLAIVSAQKGNFKATSFLLERRFPKDWGIRQQHDINLNSITATPTEAARLVREQFGSHAAKPVPVPSPDLPISTVDPWSDA